MFPIAIAIPAVIAAFAISMFARGQDSSPAPERVEADEIVAISTMGDEVSFWIGPRLALKYQKNPAPFKPYVKELYTSGGVNVLADRPPDHIHHHGLMFAVGAGETDFWSEAPPELVGTQAVESTERSVFCDVSEVYSELEWRDAAGSCLIREMRGIDLRDVRNHDISARLITWKSTLSVPGRGEAVRLWGRHYFGLGMRFVESMNGAVTFLHADEIEGRVYRGDERLTPGRWCAVHGVVDEKPVTVAMFDHPLNPRFPATWFTMSVPFAFLSATQNLEVQPRMLATDETFGLCYGVALWDGHIEVNAIESMYERWRRIEDPTQDPMVKNFALAAHGASIHASSEGGPDCAAVKVIDGKYDDPELHVWRSAQHFTPHYLRLDLGQRCPVDTIVIRHQGALPVFDGHRSNTADFRLQRSERPWGPWIDLADPVRGNTDNVTTHRFWPTVNTRYIRLLIETSGQAGDNAFGRIAEIEVYVLF